MNDWYFFNEWGWARVRNGLIRWCERKSCIRSIYDLHNLYRTQIYINSISIAVIFLAFCLRPKLSVLAYHCQATVFQMRPRRGSYVWRQCWLFGQYQSSLLGLGDQACLVESVDEIPTHTFRSAWVSISDLGHTDSMLQSANWSVPGLAIKYSQKSSKIEQKHVKVLRNV